MFLEWWMIILFIIVAYLFSEWRANNERMMLKGKLIQLFNKGITLGSFNILNSLISQKVIMLNKDNMITGYEGAVFHPEIKTDITSDYDLIEKYNNLGNSDFPK